MISLVAAAATFGLAVAQAADVEKPRAQPRRRRTSPATGSAIRASAAVLRRTRRRCRRRPARCCSSRNIKGPYDAKRAKERESDAKGEPIAGSGVDCLPYGMPEMMSAIYPLEILQTPGQVTIIAEAFSQVRRIYLGKTQPKIEDVPPGYYGHSVGALGRHDAGRGYRGREGVGAGT